MPGSDPVKAKPIGFFARHRRGAQMFVGLLLVLGCVVITFALNRDWFHTVKSYYAGALSQYLNSSDNESIRAALIEQLVDIYKETPAGKSLALRDDAGRVIGRFRIDDAYIVRDQKKPRR